MRKLLIPLVFVLLSTTPTPAFDVSCSITNLTARQQVWADLFVALQNAELPAGATPYTDISDYCARTTKSSSAASWIQQMRVLMADTLHAAGLEHGDETAPNGHCSAAGLSPGCVKFEVACFVLSGAADCEP